MSSANTMDSIFDPFEMTASSSGGSFEFCPSGNYPGVMVGLIHMGTHSETFNDGNTKDVAKLALLFELPGENKADGMPHVLVKEVTGTFSEKSNLRKLVEGWRGRKFDEGEKFSPAKLLGRECLVSVVNKKTSKGKDVSEISGIGAVPKGMTVPRPHHAPFSYAVASGQPVPALEWAPFIFGESIPDICRRSREWVAMNGGAAGGAPKPSPAPAVEQEPGAGEIEDKGDDDIPW